MANLQSNIEKNIADIEKLDAQSAISAAEKQIQAYTQEINNNPSLDPRDRTSYEQYIQAYRALIERKKWEFSRTRQTTQHDLQSAKVEWTMKKNTAAENASAKEALDDYRKEAEASFKNLLVKDGQLDIGSFKNAMALADEMANLSQNLDEGAGKNKNYIGRLETQEREQLQKEMPAVRGMIGSLFVKSLIDNGYQFRVDSSGRVNIGRADAYTPTTLVPKDQMEITINEEISRNPNFATLLRAGLLFQDDDLVKYSALISDKDGIIADANTQTFANYKDHLSRNRNRGAAANMILNNNSPLFSDKEFQEYLRAAPMVPKITSDLQKMANDPKVQTGLVAAIKEEKGTVNTSSQTEWEALPTFEESIQKHGKVMGTLEQVTVSYGKAWKLLTSGSPASFIGALALLGGLGWMMWFKNLFKTLLFGIPAVALTLGAWSYLFDTDKKTVTAKPLPAADPKTVEETRKDIHKWENLAEILPTLDTFKSAKIGDIQKYIKDKSWQLDEEQKKLLDDQKIQNHVVKEVNGQLAKLDTAIAAEKQLATPEMQKYMEQFKANLTLDELTNLANGSPEELSNYFLGLLQQMKNDPKTTPEQKKDIDDIAKAVQEGGKTMGNILWAIATITVGWTASIFMIKTALVSLTKAGARGFAEGIRSRADSKIGWNSSSTIDAKWEKPSIWDRIKNAFKSTAEGALELDPKTLERGPTETPAEYTNRMNQLQNDISARKTEIEQLKTSAKGRDVRKLDSELKSLTDAETEIRNTVQPIENIEKNSRLSDRVRDRINTGKANPRVEYKINAGTQAEIKFTLTWKDNIEFESLTKELMKHDGKVIAIQRGANISNKTAEFQSATEALNKMGDLIEAKSGGTMTKAEFLRKARIVNGAGEVRINIVEFFKTVARK